MAEQSIDQLAQDWRRYRQVADQPDWFTRWMLDRTLVVLRWSSSSSTHENALVRAAELAIVTALDTQPLPPPIAVERRVELLHLRLTGAQASTVAGLFLQSEELPSGDVLDELQVRRKNPWGGFREAWLEHYNLTSNSHKRSSGMADKEVQSEVAGTVWKVLVKEGDAVTQDQELMILESMKMEIPVEAPCAGTVAKVLVAPEEGIEEDQVLLIIES